MFVLLYLFFNYILVLVLCLLVLIAPAKIETVINSSALGFIGNL